MRFVLKEFQNSFGEVTGKSVVERFWLSGQWLSCCTDVSLTLKVCFAGLLFLSSSRHYLSYNDCLEDKRDNYENCSVLGCVWRLCTVNSSSVDWRLIVSNIIDNVRFLEELWDVIGVTVFWATVCKTVRRMLSDPLSVLSVCLWHSCTVAKRLDGSRWNLACR